MSRRKDAVERFPASTKTSPQEEFQKKIEELRKELKATEDGEAEWQAEAEAAEERAKKAETVSDENYQLLCAVLCDRVSFEGAVRQLGFVDLAEFLSSHSQ